MTIRGILGAGILDLLEGVQKSVGIGGMSIFLVVGALVAVNARRLNRHWLILGYFFCLMLSGSSIDILHTFSTLVRWCLIAVIAISVQQGSANAGGPCRLLGFAALFGMLSSSWSLPGSELTGFYENAIAFVFLMIAAPSCSDAMSTKNRILAIPNYYCLGSAVYVMLTLLAAPQASEDLGGQRFSGGNQSVVLFVVNGGILLPPLIWKIKKSQSLWVKTYCSMTSLLIVLLGVLSATRSGLYAGLIGSLFMLRFRAKHLLLLILLCVGTYVSATRILNSMPVQKEYVHKRFFETGNNGRTSRWNRALELCLANPVVGYGAGSSTKREYGFHNAFLLAWHDKGLIGLGCVSMAYILMLRQSSSLAFGQQYTEDVNDIGRLCLAWTVVLVLVGCVESKLLSPTNIMMFTSIFVSIIVAATKRRIAIEGQYRRHTH